MESASRTQDAAESTFRWMAILIGAGISHISERRVREETSTWEGTGRLVPLLVVGGADGGTVWPGFGFRVRGGSFFPLFLPCITWLRMNLRSSGSAFSVPVETTKWTEGPVKMCERDEISFAPTYSGDFCIPELGGRMLPDIFYPNTL